MENKTKPSLELDSQGDAKRIRCLTNIREVIHSYIQNRQRIDGQSSFIEEIITNIRNESLDQDDVKNILLNGKFCNNLFQLFDHEGMGYLIQDDWMAEIKKRSYDLKLGYSPNITSMVEMLETVTYLVCQEGFVYEENFGKIMGVKNLSEKLMEVVGTTGKMCMEELMGFIMVITSPHQDDGLTPDGVKRLEKVFRDIVGDEGHFTLTQFKQIVSSKNDFFVQRTFKIFDKDGSGTVSLAEFIEGMNQYASQTNEKKISFLFKIYDINNDGLICKNEMIEMMKACMQESGLDFDQNIINDLVEAFYEDAVYEDGVCKGATGITVHHLLKQLEKHEGLLENMTICIGRWLVPLKSKRKKKITIPKKLTWDHWREKKPLFFWMLAIALLNISFMIERFYYFRDIKMLDGVTPNYFYMLSRCFGKLALVNSMLVITFVLRYSLTIMRNLGLGVYIPIDHNIFIHKVLGWFLFFCASIHTIMHFCNFAINVQPNPVRYVQINADYHDHVNGGAKLDVNGVQEFLAGLGYKSPPGCEIVDLRGNYTDPCPIMPINNVLKLRGNHSCPYEDQIDPLFVCQSCGEGSHPWTYFDWILTSKPHLFGMIPGWANPTGVGLITLFTIMTLLSLPFVRRSGHFQVFYVSHLLFWVYFILLMLHAPTVWPFMGPFSLLIIELLYRNINSLMGHGKTKVNAGVLHHSKVTQLIIKRPSGFNFSPGDWVFVKIPKVAVMEWHAFTISSAPEVTGTFTLHIRSVGGWTNRLYQYFEQEYKTQHVEEEDSTAEKPIARLKRTISKVVSVNRIANPPEPLEKKYELDNNLKSGAQEDSQRKFQRYLSDTGPIKIPPKLKRIKSERYSRAEPTIVKFGANVLDNHEEEVEETHHSNQINDITLHNIETGRKTNLTKSLEIFIDGPFGSPSSDIYRAEHAVLIATGIGVTPYASILQSLMNKYRQSKSHCPKCNYQWADETYEEFSMFNLKKVDFFWINRDQKSIEWFTKLLSELEIEQAEQAGVMERLLDMHIYITSALEKTDMKAVGLQLAMDLLHKKENRDSVTGLKARTKAGRPNWDKVFRKIQEERKGKVSVFYCGNPILAKELNKKCVEFGFKFKKETF